MNRLKLTTPEALRAALMHTIEGVMEGRVNAERANAIAALSGEIHKSIRQEWDCRVYVAENLTYAQSRIVSSVIGLEDSAATVVDESGNTHVDDSPRDVSTPVKKKRRK